ncbi:MAG: ABC transporter substrate-binding protein [Planctomycetota bacterium]
MKPIVNLSRNIVILCLCLVALAGLHCRRRNGRTSAHESKITLLCMRDDEYSVFRDGQGTQFLVFIPLVDKDEEGQPHPRLLERWEHSKDYTEWTFYLRKDVKWHDGKPVTAHDVKFTLELFTDPNILMEYRVFEEITVIDNFTCRIRSNRPFNALVTCNWYGILPKHLLEGLDPAEFFSWEFWIRPVGNGPYRYVRHVPKTMVELEANPDYYRGKPKEIERVVLKFGENPLIELMSGNVDAVNNLPPLEAIKIAKDSHFNMYHTFDNMYSARDFNKVFTIIWNHRNDLFRNPAVRRALTLAINRCELHGVLNFPDNLPIFDVLITKGQFLRGELPEPLPYDPEQAKRLLDEAGWFEVKKDGVRKNNGREFRFSLLVSAEQTLGAVYIQDQFRKVGISMEIVTLSSGVLMTRRRLGEFDACLFYIRFHDYKEDYGVYDNPEFDRLLENAYWAPTPDERDIAVRKLWPIFRTDVPLTFLYPQVTLNIVHRRIRGLKSPNRADPAGFMERRKAGSRKNKTIRKNKMKPIINLSRNILILCLCLIALAQPNLI